MYKKYIICLAAIFIIVPVLNIHPAALPGQMLQGRVLDLRENVSILAESQQKLVPYLPGFHQDQQAYYVEIPYRDYPNAHLGFESQLRAVLYINGRMLANTVRDGDKMVWPLDSLKQLATGNLLQIFLEQPINISEVQIYLFYNNPIASLTVANDEQTIEQVTVSQPPSYHHLLVSGIACFVILAVYYQLSGFYLPNMFFVLMLRRKAIDDYSGWKSPVVIIAFILSFSFVLSFIAKICEMDTSWQNQNGSFSDALYAESVLDYFLIFSLAIGMKLILVAAVGRLTNLGSQNELYLNAYFIFTNLMLFALVTLGLLVVAQASAEGVQFLRNSVVALFVFGTVFLFVRLYSRTSKYKIHIISYFCATEILPLFVSVKYFLF